MITSTLFELLDYILGALKLAIIASAIISLLLAFNVLDSRNRAVWSIADFLFRITDPILRPIRSILPSFNGIDLSPWIAVVLIQIIQGQLPVLYHIIHTGDLQQVW